MTHEPEPRPAPERIAWPPWLIVGLMAGVLAAMIWHLFGEVDRLERQLWAEVDTLEQNMRFDLDQIEATIAYLRRDAAEEAAREEEEHAREMLRQLRPQLQFALPLPHKETEL